MAEEPSEDTSPVNSPAQENPSSPNDSSQMKINGLTLEERFQKVRSIGEECIGEEELLNLLANKPEPICYDGFEPSGRMHIAQGVMKAISVNKLTDAGCKVKIWVADWFALLNKKMGGDLKKIQTVGKYFIEIWKSVGMRNLDKVEFLWCSEEINSRAHEYWPLVMDIAERNKLPRIMRCRQIMGLSEEDELYAGQILYPCMQCADIFFLKADICQMGMDQREVNVLAREYCDDIERKNKPIILSHHMLPGLQQPKEKISIYMDDEEAEVNVKIRKAYCPPKTVEGNPCLEYIKYIVFPWFGVFEIEPEENGENKIIRSYKRIEELIADYEKGDLHPADLKTALSKALNKILKANICQMGMDQREVNVLAREYCDDIERKNKPIILSHHMLPGLEQPEEKMSKSDPSSSKEKMSKSDPSSSIYMDDEEAEVNVKIRKAYCPPKIVEGNPCLEYIKYIVFPWFGVFEIECKKNGEKKIIRSYKMIEELIADYEKEVLHPDDLKTALSKALNKILKPVRDHFTNEPNAKDLLKRVKIACTMSRKGKGSGLKTEKPSNDIPSKDTMSLPVNSPAQEKPNDSNQMKINGLTLEERFQMVRSIGEECIQEEELLNLLAKKPEPICYDGFEPSGRMHIAQGVMKAISVNKLTDAGCKVKIWVADWFAQLNNKMGGDLEKIQTVGKYLIEVWKAVGMINLDKVEFLWCSEEINSRAHEYWPLVMDIAERNKLPRIMRCCQIMGRSEHDKLTAAQILYPCMQCADIFFLKADICQLGMDQRKVNVLAREFCNDIKRKNKPIILSHHMLPGLCEGQAKMSKSDPSSSIYMEDEEVELNDKITNAHCPPKKVEGNPCLEYIKYIVFPWFGVFEIGNKSYRSFEELIADYENEDLDPVELKSALSKALNKILKPVRDHFTNDANAKDLLERVKSYKVTR